MATYPESPPEAGFERPSAPVPGPDRREQRRRRRRRARMVRSAVAATLLVAAVVGALVWHRTSSSASSHPAPTRANAPRGVGSVRALSEPTPDPTPLFANYGPIEIRLPVAVTSLTEVGFHQASYKWALAIETPLPDANMDAARGKGTGRDLTAQASGEDSVLSGSVLRMWRSRPGKPNTAIDVGAEPGTTVLAPVTGRVVRVRAYDLYGKYPDFEVHIQPEGRPEVDCVLIHIENPTVAAGDTVIAGVTSVGSVRRLSDRITMQLAEYTKGKGDHIHIQLNDATDPTYKGLEGVTEMVAPAQDDH